jgi:anti-sigma factor ChrR (cupin superfamily)
VTGAPLPTARFDVPSEMLIQPLPEGTAAALPDQVRAEVTAVLENRDQIQVPETLRSRHPIVKRWLEKKRERRKVDQLSGRRSEPPVCGELLISPESAIRHTHVGHGSALPAARP